MSQNKITSFTDLLAWKEGHCFVLMIYKELEKFPTKERFGLIDQMKRAAVSITSNIAEGFSRYGMADKVHFYRISKGSVTEIQNQLIIARDLKYLNASDFDKLAKQSISVLKLINALITGTKLKYK
jgi:four helix bundle protein